MAQEKNRGQDRSKINEAGQGELDDEMLPNQGQPQEQPDAEAGDQTSTAGQHGDMAPETARSIDEKAKEKR